MGKCQYCGDYANGATCNTHRRSEMNRDMDRMDVADHLDARYPGRSYCIEQEFWKHSSCWELKRTVALFDTERDEDGKPVCERYSGKTWAEIIEAIDKAEAEDEV